MPDITIIDAVTGEAVERDYTPEEKAQYEADIAEAEQRIEASSQARAAALAHAKALGFTDEMIAVMYPGLI